MKIYLLVSPTHTLFLQEWFLPTLQDEIPVEIRYIPQLCNGVYKSRGWTAAMIEKVSLIETAIEESWGGSFIYSDVDIQFFSSMGSVLKNLDPGVDLYFQKDSPQGMLCAGFFVCQANDRTLAFWREVKRVLATSPGQGDQDVVNALLRPTPHLFSPFLQLWKRTARPTFSYLPDSFFGGGTFTGELWKPSTKIPLPSNPILHHANWCVGERDKLAQLIWVREQIGKQIPTPVIAALPLNMRQSTRVLPSPHST